MIGQVGQREIIFFEILSVAATRPLMTSQRTRLLYERYIHNHTNSVWYNSGFLDSTFYRSVVAGNHITINAYHITHDPPAGVRPSFSVWSRFETRRSPGAATCRDTAGILKMNSKPPWAGMSSLPVTNILAS